MYGSTFFTSISIQGMLRKEDSVGKKKVSRRSQKGGESTRVSVMVSCVCTMVNHPQIAAQS